MTRKHEPLFGPYGSAAVQHLASFEENGLNACWFHGFEAAAFEACQEYDVAPCVEFKTFRADFDQNPELIPIGIDGKPIRYGRLVQGVCLSQQAFLEETEANLLAGLRDFQPAGVWLDYLTYAGWFETPEPDLQESCFCRDCIAEFCNAVGVDADTPQAILESYQEIWTRHKCERTAQFGAHYAGLIRQKYPDCIIGAYMCPWTPEEYNRALGRIFAQDYDLFAPWIDIFTPLIYAKKSGRPPGWGRDYLEAADRFVPGDCEVQLILDVLDFPESLQETAESSRPSWGVQLFGGADVLKDPQRARLLAQAVKNWSV